MIENYEKTVELISKHFIDSIDWDLQIVSDTQKYSSWFLAFSTGGLALLSGRFGVLVNGSWISEKYVFSLLVFVALILILACIAGVLHHYVSNRNIANKRQQMTFILKQKCQLFIKQEDTTDLEDLSSKIVKLRLLDESDQEKYSKLEEESEKHDQWLKFLLIGQQLLAGLGYLILVLIAIGPWT